MAARRRGPVWRYGTALLIVAGSAIAAEALFRATGNTRLSMVFLAGVLISAYVLGSGPAYLAAGAAFLTYNFYLVEPRFSLSMDPEDFITLVVFLGVAMLTGNLTGRVRDQAARADARARMTADLFEATREFSALSEESLIRQRLASRLAGAARGQAVVKERVRVLTAPHPDDAPADLLRELTELEREERDPGLLPALQGGWLMRQLRAHDELLGVTAWRADREPLTRDEETLLEILADVGGAAIARSRLAAAKAQAEARARTEDLRNALLSSISHDLRTPLAAVLASASSLYEFGESFSPEVRKDLAATVQEEATRLDAFVANLLNMTRLQSGAVVIDKVAFSVPEVVRAAVERRTGRGGGQVRLAIDPDAPDAHGDPQLFEQAFVNVLDNALRYGAGEAAIEVSIAGHDGTLFTVVRDRGPGVDPADHDRIFQKFFRASSSAGKPGTGLGLAIARGLVEGMGGGVTAANRADVDHGLEVVITLPGLAA